MSRQRRAQRKEWNSVLTVLRGAAEQRGMPLDGISAPSSPPLSLRRKPGSLRRGSGAAGKPTRGVSLRPGGGGASLRPRRMAPPLAAGGGGAAGAGGGRSEGVADAASVPPSPVSPSSSARNSGQLSDCLDRLNNMKYPVRSITAEDGAAMVYLLCLLLPSDGEELAAKLCQLTSTLSMKGQLRLSSKQLDVVMRFFLSYAPRCSSFFMKDTVSTIAYLLYENAHRCSAHYDTLLDLLLPLVGAHAVDLHAKYAAMNCVGNLLEKAASTLAAAQRAALVDAVLGSFELHAESDLSMPAMLKVLNSTTRSLHHVILHSLPEVKARAAYLLPALQRLATLAVAAAACEGDGRGSGGGLGGGDGADAAVASKGGAEEEGKEGAAEEGGSGASRKESEEESDADGKSYAARLRLNATNCLHLLCRSLPAEAVQPHWHLLLPCRASAGSRLSADSATLLTVLLHDPWPKMRAAAAATISAIVSRAKLRRLIASGPTRSKSTSFTSRSDTALTFVRELHVGLHSAQRMERDGSALSAVLKAITALITATPYESESVDSELLLRFLPGLRDCFRARRGDATVREMAGASLAAVLGAAPAVPTLHDMLSGSSELAGELIAVSKAGAEDSKVRCAALSALEQACKLYSLAVKDSWASLQPALMSCFAHRDSDLRSHAVRVVQELLRGMEGGLHLLDDGAAFLMAHLLRAFRDSYHPVRCAAVTCFTLVGEEGITALRAEEMKSIVDAVVVASRDEAPKVRTAACRFVGVYVLRSASLPLPSFGRTALSVIRACIADDKPAVRARAMWACSNLCQALVDSWGGDAAMLDSSEVDSLAAELLSRMDDSDKVLSSTVRAFGALGAILSAPRLAEVLLSLAGKLEVLSPKLAWNAAVAIGRLLPSTAVLPAESIAVWRAPLLAALATAVRACRNFKVRIHAALALRQLSSRATYGDSLLPSLDALLAALRSIDRLEDYSEFKYKSALTAELQGSMVHLLALLADQGLPGELAQALTVARLPIISEWLQLLLLTPEEALPPSVKRAVVCAVVRALLDEAATLREGAGAVDESDDCELALAALRTVMGSEEKK